LCYNQLLAITVMPHWPTGSASAPSSWHWSTSSDLFITNAGQIAVHSLVPVTNY